jgi:hypothetical protein
MHQKLKLSIPDSKNEWSRLKNLQNLSAVQYSQEKRESFQIERKELEFLSINIQKFQDHNALF